MMMLRTYESISSPRPALSFSLSSFLACAFDSGPGLWLALLEDQSAHREDAHRGGDTDSERLAQWSQL